MPRAVQVTLLGEPQVLASTGEHIPLEGKQAALLAYLVIDGPAARERVASLLWPTADAERARGNLRQCLLRLRRRVELVDDERQGALRLVDGVSIDIRREAAEDDPQSGALPLLGSLQFADCPRFAAWLDRQRAARSARRREHALDQARAHFESGHFGAAVIAAERAVAADPAAEEPYRCLMQWHALRGDRAAALQVWDRCLETLRRGYGLSPSAQTVRLARTIEGSAPAAAATAPDPRSEGAATPHATAAAPPPTPAPEPIPPTLLRPPQLIGRETTLARMHGVWRFGHVIIVEGEAGVGKSRLLDEFILDDGSIGRSGARPGDAAVPLCSIARLFAALAERYRPELVEAVASDCARLVPSLARTAGAMPPPLDTDADRLRFHAALREFLACCGRQGARGLAFDDLQFADAASVATLGALLDDPVLSMSLRVVIAVRREEAGAAASALLDQMTAAGRVARIALKSLNQAQVEQFLSTLALEGIDSAGWSAALARQTGGNPAFLLESLKTLYTEGWLSSRAPRPPWPLPVPPTVESAIDRRLGHLSPAALALGQLAAIAGADFEIEAAATILGQPPLALAQPLDELERAQILRGNAFAHDLVLDAVQRSVPQAVRAYLHRAMAEQLRQRGAAPGRIAVHFAGAACWDDAAVHWRAAADAAAHASQLADQVGFLEQAEACFARAGRREGRFAALLAIASIEKQPDYGARLPACIERLRELQAGESERMEVDLVEADLAINRGTYDTAERLARAALESARRLAPGEREAAACGRLAHALVYLGRPHEALEVLENLPLAPAAIRDPRQRAALHEKRALALAGCGRLKLAIEDAQQVVAIGRASRNLSLAFDGLYDVALMHAWHGAAARAAELFGEAIELRDRLGRTGAAAAAADCQVGAVLRDLGRYGEAIECLERAQRRFDQDALPGWSIKARADLADTFLLLGQPERASQIFGRIPEGLAAPEVAARLVVRSRIERETGASGAARETLRLAAEMLPDSASPRIVLPIAIEQARDLDARSAGGRLRALADAALRCELVGLGLYASALAVAAALRADPSAAAHVAAHAATLRDGYEPVAIPRAWMLAVFAAALRASEPRLAAQLQEETGTWSERVADDLPEGLRTTFLSHLRRAEHAAGVAAPARPRNGTVRAA
ncbi:MAG TPA: AAA family ATPase [Burkholderiaceae bacterium]|nr:AAA family ATPase [Burkholderiaceae bacterium]